MNNSLSLDATTERANFRNYVIEIAWFGLAIAATSRFLSVYAIRVGATPIDLGWMTALPFIILLISTSLSAWWRARFKHPMRSYFLPSVGFRLAFLLPAFTPLFPLHLQPLWLIMSIVLPALPQGISATVFVSMMRDAIYNERQTPLASKRMLWMSVMTGAGALIFGLWLEAAPFPLNYQIMFLLSFALALISHAYVMRVKVPAALPQASGVQSKAAPLRSADFRQMVRVTVIAHIVFLALAPIIPLYLVNNLGADEGYMAIFGLAEITAAAVICLFTDRIIRKIGNRKMIALAMVGTAAAALTMGLSQNLTMSLVAGAVSGAAWTAAAIAMYGAFVEATKQVASTDMTRYTTTYHQLAYIAAFIGPMLGSNLANLGVNLVLVIILGAVLRLGAGILILNLDAFAYLPVRRIRQAFHLR